MRNFENVRGSVSCVLVTVPLEKCIVNSAGDDTFEISEGICSSRHGHPVDCVSNDRPCWKSMVKGPSEPEAPLHTTSASRTKVQRRAFFNRRSPLTQPPPGIAAHPANDDDEYCEDLQGLRVALNAGLQNVGVLAAFMTSLSGAIYVSLPSPNECMGMKWLHAELVLSWMAMGCFFFTIISAVILSDDLDGVPDQLLVRHVHNIRYVSSGQDSPGSFFCLRVWMSMSAASARSPGGLSRHHAPGEFQRRERHDLFWNLSKGHLKDIE